MNFFENSFDFPLEPCYHGDIIDCCLEQDLMDVNTGHFVRRIRTAARQSGKCRVNLQEETGEVNERVRVIGSYLDEWNIVTITVRLILAVVCGGAIGLTRSVKRRGAGFKTHALVCLGSALVMMTGQILQDWRLRLSAVLVFLGLERSWSQEITMSKD